ncbi:MAG: hypothetical protein H7Y38_14895 [Armatimonadetes bacterium]|nr:hypothetical protein [Armatimonadota bacterium]
MPLSDFEPLARRVRVSSDTLRRVLSGSRPCSFALASRLAAHGIALNNFGDRCRPATPSPTDFAPTSVVRDGGGRANVRPND